MLCLDAQNLVFGLHGAESWELGRPPSVKPLRTISFDVVVQFLFPLTLL